MYQHIVDVRNRAIRIVSGRTIVQGNVGVDKLSATFDNVWDGCEIAVIFENGGGFFDPLQVCGRDGYSP